MDPLKPSKERTLNGALTLEGASLSADVTNLPRPLPAKAVLVMQRITQRRVAIALGMSELTVGRVLNGYEKPSPRFRAGLAKFLERPERELFRDE